MSAEQERAKIFAALPLEVLRKTRNDAAARGNLQLANEVLHAINVRTSTQHPEIADCGRLFEHVEPPSVQNGGRFITTYTGDPIAWMAPFMAGGQRCRLDLEPDVVAKTTVKLKAGESIRVVGPDGNVIRAA